MRPFKFVRSMQEWTFSTTTRSVELLNIALLAHLTILLSSNRMDGINIHGIPLEQLRVPVFLGIVAVLTLAQFISLVSEKCEKCRKFSGFLLSLSSLLWLFVISVALSDYAAAAALGISKSYVSVYGLTAVLCYFAAEFIREYLKTNAE